MFIMVCSAIRMRADPLRYICKNNKLRSNFRTEKWLQIQEQFFSVQRQEYLSMLNPFAYSSWHTMFQTSILYLDYQAILFCLQGRYMRKEVNL